MKETENSSNKFLAFLKNNITQIIGVVLGIVGGYIYYRSVGCTSGSCAITSNVWLSMAWGAAAGYLIAGMFKPGGCRCNTSNNSTSIKNEN